jgi:hypothetical protein
MRKEETRIALNQRIILKFGEHVLVPADTK